jgi:hypothetical protein
MINNHLCKLVFLLCFVCVDTLFVVCLYGEMCGSGCGRYSPNGMFVLTNSVDNIMRLLRPFGDMSYPSNDWSEPGNGNGRSSRPNNTFRCDMGMAPEIKRYTGHRSERHCSPAVFAILDVKRALRSRQVAEREKRKQEGILSDDASDDGSSSDEEDQQDVVIAGSEDGSVSRISIHFFFLH